MCKSNAGITIQNDIHYQYSILNWFRFASIGETSMNQIILGKKYSKLILNELPGMNKVN